jgi:hypothetical protein
MGPTRGPPATGRERAKAKDSADADGEGSSADVFALLWAGLADILGTAAGATLLRRAAQCALPRAPELAALQITRQSLDYRYTLPSSWSSSGSDPRVALLALTRELWPLLVDLTGSVVIQRLEQVPELRALVAAQREETEV